MLMLLPPLFCAQFLSDPTCQTILGTTMAKSIFSSDVSSRLEQEGNLFLTCRGLSSFARTLNSQKPPEAEPEAEAPEEANALSTVLSEFTDGRIEPTPAA